MDSSIFLDSTYDVNNILDDFDFMCSHKSQTKNLKFSMSKKKECDEKSSCNGSITVENFDIVNQIASKKIEIENTFALKTPDKEPICELFIDCVGKYKCKDDEKNIEDMYNVYFPSQQVLSQKVWHLKHRNTSKVQERIKYTANRKKSETVARKKPCIKVENKVISDLESRENYENNPLIKNKFHGEHEFTYEKECDMKKNKCILTNKRLNQLKLSDMLPAKKKVVFNFNSKDELKIQSESQEKDIGKLLYGINEFLDPNFAKDMGFGQVDVDKNINVQDVKIQTKSKEIIRVTKENFPNNDTQISTKLTTNKVQTILESKYGQILVKKGPNNDTKNEKNKTKVKPIAKSKFIPPSQKTNINVEFSIKQLFENDIEEITDMLSKDLIQEIGFTILFKEGFCQLNKTFGTTDKICTPCSIIFYISSSTNDELKYYTFNIFRLTPDYKQTLKILLSTILVCNIQKICFESQELIMLLFDIFHFQREDICLKWNILDPKIACFLLDPDNSPQSFSNILQQLSFNENINILNTCPQQRAAYYLEVLSKSFKDLRKSLVENWLWHIFISIETKLTTILSVMELRGICTDNEILKDMESTLNAKLKDTEQRAYNAAGKCFQINSPIQLRKILYDELQLDLKHNIQIKKTERMGAKSTSECVLRSLVGLHPLPELILNYRNTHKAKTTFVDAIIQQSKNGLLRTRWEQTSASTGRVVSCNPNLQAIPKQPLNLELFPKKGTQAQKLQLRNAFVSHPNHTFVGVDFQHIECRVFAHLTQDRTLIESFKKDIDIFIALSMKWMKKISYDDISKEDRDKTKHLVYALMYGAGTQKISEILNVDTSQTSNIISKFLDSFPSLQTFKRDVLIKCREQNGVLNSLYGRMRKFHNINSSDPIQRSYSERQAVNFVIQGSAADICKLAMISTEDKLNSLPKPLNHHLVLQIHDELVWEVPDCNISEFISFIKEVLHQSKGFCKELSVPLPVSIVSGKSWGEMS